MIAKQWVGCETPLSRDKYERLLDPWIPVNSLTNIIMEYNWWGLGPKNNDKDIKQEDVMETIIIPKTGAYLLQVTCKLDSSNHHCMRILLSNNAPHLLKDSQVLSVEHYVGVKLQNSILLHAQKDHIISIMIAVDYPAHVYTYDSILRQVA
jgi:hypothetical protein